MRIWFSLMTALSLAPIVVLNISGLRRVADAALSVDARRYVASLPQARSPGAHVVERPRTAAAILARNPFDSENAPLLDPNAPARMPTDDAQVRRCDGVKILIVAQSSDPDWSFAALTDDTPDAQPRLRRRGGDFEGRRVERVDWDRVWLSRNGAVCAAVLFAGRAVSPTKPPGASTDSQNANGVGRVDAAHFEVERSVIERALQNQSELMKLRLVPEQEGGKPVGIRLFNIKKDSLLAAIGLEDGDRLEAINGLDMTTPTRALQAYGQLLAARDLTVTLTRKGTKLTLNYAIH